MKRRSIPLLMSWLLALSAEAREVRISDAKVNFLAVGRPAMIKIRGESSELESQLNEQNAKVSGSFKFKLDTLTTGISLRDRHMKEKYLETPKYPEATLSFMNFPKPNEPGKFSADCILSLHGKERPVKVDLETNGSKVHAAFKTVLSDFAIEVPSYAGIKVADQVEVTVDFIIKTE